MQTGRSYKVNAEQKIEAAERLGFAHRVKGAVLWRSGSQMVAQIVAWGSTFLVIRLLEPQDYGLVAMTQVVLVFLNLMNGWGFSNALIRAESIGRREIRQVFGMMVLLNGTLACLQLLLAPLAAAYFRQPMIADLLRVQALLYISNPFIAIATALLSRELEFRRQGIVNLAAAGLSAATALAFAYAGFGVWTLIAAPLVLWWAQAIGLTVAARSLMWPSFRFAGAGALFGFGGAMVIVQFFWFVQSQADVFIAGRLFSPHDLGIYTTALFLTQILAAKFVPPLNEVAFAAYAKIQSDRDVMGRAFLKAVRLIMLVALPFYFGLAVTAEPLVLTFLGAKWAETIGLVTLLALAMPLMTLQILFAPATNALGRPAVAVRVAIAGAVLMPICFLIGVRWGISGLAWAWLSGMAMLTLATAALALPVIGVSARALMMAVAPGLLASLSMAALVSGLDMLLPSVGPGLRLAILAPAGAAAYCALLFFYARPVVEEVAAVLLPARREAATA